MKSAALSRRQRAAKTWYRDGLPFECAQCGGCCTGAPGFVWVSRKEIATIAAKLKIDEETFSLEYLRYARGKYSLRERDNGDCVLLDPEKRTCMVYDERPVQCRTWPWWEENLASRESWESCGKGCPGINNGRKHSATFIEQQLEKDNKAAGDNK